MSSTTETNSKTAEATTNPFAVIETGGKQYLVTEGDELDVELLSDSKEGDTLTFDKVLLTDNGKATKVGTPYVAGTKVTATHVGDKKGKKLSIIRFKAKSNRSRKVGHRQPYTRIKIEKIA
jgi:large subunit ribosomal protein L21